MSRRFDRLEDGEKLHMQSLCALAHFDFNQAGAYSYEQAFERIGRDRKPHLCRANRKPSEGCVRRR
jgi:serine/threonine protein kinase HipA of HipAB toxin-antitoxin module